MKDEKTAEFAMLVEKLEQNLEPVLKGLAVLETTENNRAETSAESVIEELNSTDIARLTPLFAELNNLLKSGHSKSEEKLAEIGKLLLNNAKTHLGRIQEQIEDYEFEEAMETLSEAASLLGISIKIGAGK